MELEKKNIIEIAKLCSISYFNQDFMNKTFQEIDCIDVIDNRKVIKKCIRAPKLYSSSKDCQVYIYEFQDTIYICFRGTESIDDLFTNIKIRQETFILPNFNQGYYPSVHQGFLEQFNSVKDLVSEEINLEKKIIFCGHSLGGALASIASLYYSYLFNKLDFCCITFGSPRVGNYLFSRLFDYRIKKCYRFINDRDPIPEIISFWIYEHTKGYYLLKNNSNQTEEVSWYEYFKEYVNYFLSYGKEMIEDHNCESYIRELGNSTSTWMN